MTSCPATCEQARDAVADHGLAAVAERERSRRVGGHELDLDARAGAAAARPNRRRPRAPDRRARAASTSFESQRFRKPGPATSARATRPPASPRRAASSSAISRGGRRERLGEDQRGVAGEVAVLGLSAAARAGTAAPRPRNPPRRAARGRSARGPRAGAPSSRLNIPLAHSARQGTAGSGRECLRRARAPASRRAAPSPVLPAPRAPARRDPCAAPRLRRAAPCSAAPARGFALPLARLHRADEATSENRSRVRTRRSRRQHRPEQARVGPDAPLPPGGERDPSSPSAVPPPLRSLGNRGCSGSLDHAANAIDVQTASQSRGPM